MLIELTFAAGIMLAAPGPDSPVCSDPIAVVGECVQEQLPEETNGRQIDCPDGQVGYVEADMVICPPHGDPAPTPATAADPPATVAPPASVPTEVAVVAPAPAAPPVVPTLGADLWNSVLAFLRALFGSLL